MVAWWMDVFLRTSHPSTSISYPHSDMNNYHYSRRERWVNTLINRLAHLLVKTDLDDLQQIPSQGPLILITNHVNMLEGPIVYTQLQRILPRYLTGFAKVEFWDNPITGFLFDTWDAIPLNRGEADLKAIKEAVARIKAGAIFAMAPEGTRSREAQLLRAHSGIAMLGYMSESPILPMASYGHEKYVSDLKRFHRSTYHLNLGKPFKLDTGGKRVKGDMRQEMADEIMYQLAALLPEQYRGVYSDLSKLTSNYLNFDVGFEIRDGV
jgi:1-acyl-sn-glycerol-3-phosphate acyltransferase